MYFMSQEYNVKGNFLFDSNSKIPVSDKFKVKQKELSASLSLVPIMTK